MGKGLLREYEPTGVDEEFFDKKFCGLNRARRLLYLNVAGAVAHLSLAIVALAVAGANGDVNTPIVSTYMIELGYDNASSDPYIPSVLKYGSFSIPWATFAFFFLSFLAHFTIVVCNWSQMRATNAQSARQQGWRGWYLVWLSSAQNPARWLEYFASASVMILLIAVVGGISNVFTLIALYALIATTQIFGHLAELANPADSDGTWLKKSRLARLWPSLLGWVPYVPVWIIVLWNFHRAIDKAAANGREVPGFVYGIIYGQIVLFSLFAIPQLVVLGLTNGPKYYWIGEASYLVLSLTSKAVLGLLFIASTFAFDSLEESVTA